MNLKIIYNSVTKSARHDVAIHTRRSIEAKTMTEIMISNSEIQLTMLDTLLD